MRADAYIVIDLDSGPLCVTTGDPGAKEFDEEIYVFIDSIVSITAPGIQVDPIAVSLSSGSFGVKIVSDEMAGGFLSTRRRLAGSLCHMWIEVEGLGVVERFSGQVESAAFGLNEDTLEFGFAPRRDVSSIPVPGRGYMDEGRFVERVSFVATEEGGFTQEISVLRPAMEFKSAFGTPSLPGFSSYIFKSLEVPLGAGGSYDPGDLYLFFSDSASDEVVPIIYGSNQSVSVSPLAHYRVEVGGSRFKVFIFPIAEHPIVGDPSLGATSFGDFTLIPRWNDIEIPMYGIRGTTETDGLGGSISYVTLPIRYADGDDTYEEVYEETLKGFNESEVYFKTVVGKIAPGGGPMTGLGDILFDMYQTQSSVSQSYINWQHTSPSLQELNAYSSSIVLNARAQGQTLQAVLSQRLQAQFPFVSGPVGGTFAIQNVGIPSKIPPAVRSLSYDMELSSRSSLDQTPLGEIINETVIQYGVSGSASNNTESITINRLNSEFARASYDRWGPRPVNSVSIPDIQSASTAYELGEEILRRRGGVRLRASYESFDLTLTSLNLMSVVNITDEDCGLLEEPFYFLGYQWSDDLSSVTAFFLSANMV
jgi:hypothetical protein